MDAAEDREVKLQRASGDLVQEFSEKLPSLLWKTRPEQPNTRIPRRWTPAAKTERLVGLVSKLPTPFPNPNDQSTNLYCRIVETADHSTVGALSGVAAAAGPPPADPSTPFS